MIYPKIPLAQSIIQICLAKGLTNVVISPGSRNAPLIIGFVSNPKFKCYSIADERCAAFFALGIAQQTGKPAIVVCTSGSALLNFYPAFAESFYSQIPIVVISADRPPQMIDIGDGQTIRQENVFHNHSVYNANLGVDASNENEFEINHAINKAYTRRGPVHINAPFEEPDLHAINKAYTRRGPVHINAPFEEPLYEITKKLEVDVTISAFAKVYKTISVEDILAYTNIWNTASRKLILVGVNEPDEFETEVLEKLVADNSVVVMTETTSNIHHADFVTNIDRIITPFSSKHFLAFQPEIVVTFGGMVVSKRIKSFLRTYKPEHHWHIDPIRAYDTFDSLTKHFDATPNDFFQQFLPFTKFISSDYKKDFTKIKSFRKKKHDQFLATAQFSDLKAFSLLIPKLPKDCQLHIANSASIRYAQLFDIDPTIEVYCNRGTSGIDGSTSTAIGAASANGRQTVLITGDVGFLYDSNALWNEYIPKNFKIIIINNGGGGIFRILPGHQENTIFNQFFETSHCLTAEHLAKMYGFNYFIASDESSLNSASEKFYSENERPCIMEVFTPTKDNDKVLKNYFKALA